MIKETKKVVTEITTIKLTSEEIETIILNHVDIGDGDMVLEWDECSWGGIRGCVVKITTTEESQS